MSYWMTSGGARLKATQKRPFQTRCLQTAKRINPPILKYFDRYRRSTKEVIKEERPLTIYDIAKLRYTPANPIRRRGIVVDINHGPASALFHRRSRKSNQMEECRPETSATTKNCVSHPSMYRSPMNSETSKRHDSRQKQRKIQRSGPMGSTRPHPVRVQEPMKIHEHSTRFDETSSCYHVRQPQTTIDHGMQSDMRNIIDSYRSQDLRQSSHERGGHCDEIESGDKCAGLSCTGTSNIDKTSLRHASYHRSTRDLNSHHVPRREKSRSNWTRSGDPREPKEGQQSLPGCYSRENGGWASHSPNEAPHGSQYYTPTDLGIMCSLSPYPSWSEEGTVDKEYFDVGPRRKISEDALRYCSNDHRGVSSCSGQNFGIEYSMNHRVAQVLESKRLQYCGRGRTQDGYVRYQWNPHQSISGKASPKAPRYRGPHSSQYAQEAKKNNSQSAIPDIDHDSGMELPSRPRRTPSNSELLHFQEFAETTVDDMWSMEKKASLMTLPWETEDFDNFEEVYPARAPRIGFSPIKSVKRRKTELFPSQDVARSDTQCKLSEAQIQGNFRKTRRKNVPPTKCWPNHLPRGNPSFLGVVQEDDNSLSTSKMEATSVTKTSTRHDAIDLKRKLRNMFELEELVHRTESGNETNLPCPFGLNWNAM